MAEYGDILLAFYNGSKGTSNMIKTAIDKELDVFIVHIPKSTNKKQTKTKK